MVRWSESYVRSHERLASNAGVRSSPAKAQVVSPIVLYSLRLGVVGRNSLG